MTVTAWNNGSFYSTGAGYGLRLNSADRDNVFSGSWSHVFLDLPNGTNVRVHLSSSFWRNCSELRSAAIGKWLITAGHGRWPHGSPPVFALIQVGGNQFRIV